MWRWYGDSDYFGSFPCAALLCRCPSDASTRSISVCTGTNLFANFSKTYLQTDRRPYLRIIGKQSTITSVSMYATEVQDIMSYSECVAGICTAHVFLLNERRRRRNWRRWWTWHFLNKGTGYGENLAYLKLEDGAGFRNFVRMTLSDFEILLQIIGSKISGTETKYRTPIPPSIRLAVTVRYLAAGESFTKGLLQRTPASLGIHQFLGFCVKLHFQCLYFLLYLHRNNTVFCSQNITCINYALLLPDLT
jgi:hypothetical protein